MSSRWNAYLDRKAELRSVLTLEDHRLADAVARYTLGWNKPRNAIGSRWLIEKSGLHGRSFGRARNHLVAIKLLRYDPPPRSGRGNRAEWELLLGGDANGLDEDTQETPAEEREFALGAEKAETPAETPAESPAGARAGRGEGEKGMLFDLKENERLQSLKGLTEGALISFPNEQVSDAPAARRERARVEPLPQHERAGSVERDRLVEAALAYAKHFDASVVPVIGKRPCTPHGYASASAVDVEIRAMFKHVNPTGVGIAAHGRFVIIDVDDPAALATLPSLPLTLMAQSGSGRGFHAYYLRPPGIELSCRMDRFSRGVEVKLGNSGCVAPPSTHPCGHRYEWLHQIEPVEAPDWLLGLLTPPAMPPMPPKPPSSGETAYGRTVLDRKVADVAAAEPGTRQRTLNGAAYACAQIVPSGHLHTADITAALTATANAAGLPAGEAASTIRRALEAGQRNPYFPQERR